MANKKKKSANRPKTVSAPASDKLARDREEFEDSVREQSKPAKTEEKTSVKDKDKDRDKDKDKKKTVVKSQARAKDPKKAKKPNLFRRFVDYLKQVRLEIKRTTWPTKNEVLNMTIIVMVALAFFGTLIFLIDLAMVELLNLYGQLIPEGGTTLAAADAAANGADAANTDTAAVSVLNFFSFLGGE